MEQAELDVPFVTVHPSADHADVPQLLFTLDWQSLQGQDCARRQLRERHTCLRGAKVETVLRIADCSEHSFDVKDGSEATFGGQSDEAVEFLCSALVDPLTICTSYELLFLSLSDLIWSLRSNFRNSFVARIPVGAGSSASPAGPSTYRDTHYSQT